MFVLGYGLHLADLYRNVPRVVDADREVVARRPGRLRRRARTGGDAAEGAEEAGARVAPRPVRRRP